VIESQPLQDGRNMVMMLGPVKAPQVPAATDAVEDGATPEPAKD
jgi:hypothetical protein